MLLEGAGRPASLAPPRSRRRSGSASFRRGVLEDSDSTPPRPYSGAARAGGRGAIPRPWRAGRLALLVAAVLPRGVQAISKPISETTNVLWVWIAANIGLDPASTITIDLYNDRPANDTYVMVLTYEQRSVWQSLRSDPGDTGPTFDGYLVSYWRGVLTDQLHARLPVRASGKDRYNIGILNPHRSPLQLRGEVSLIGPNGEELPLQSQSLPGVLLATATLFLGTIAACAVLVAITRRRTPIHAVMGSTVALKGVVLLLWWFDCWQMARTGLDSAVSSIGWQLLDKVQTIMELMMFLLIALGWKIIRGSLQVTEVRFAVGLSIISFYLGVFEVACTTQSTCSGYQLSRYILHSLCYLVVIVAMNFNLQMLYAQLVDAPASLESSKLYRKYQAYRVFRWIFLAFIIAPTVELFLKVSVIPWDATWLFVLIQQLRTWAIYVCVLGAFRPEPPPLRVFELTRDAGSDDEAGLNAPGAAGVAE